MNDGHIQVRISAAADRSVEAVFGSIERRGARMRDNLNRSTAAGIGNAMGRQAQQADRAAAAVERAAKRKADAEAREAARATREIERNYRLQQVALDRAARAQDAIHERMARNAARLRDREAREATRAANRQAQEADAWRRKMAYRTAYHGVVRYAPGMVGHAGRVSMDLLRGAGVDFTIGSIASRVSAYQGQVTRLQNQASFNDQALARPALERSIKGAADKYGFSRAETGSALERFAAKTGDMNLGMQLLDRVAARAAASGANLDDMMDAAGDAASNIGNVKDKAAAVTHVLDDWTVQGAKGAVEMKDLASKAARLAAPAARFEGDAAQNMGKLGALAQLARQSGGAASASEATNAVARFADQLRTPARVRQFQALGIDVFSKTEKGQLRDPFEVVKDALSKTNGDPLKLKKLFASSIGDKPVAALASEYNRVGGGKAGLVAVEKKLSEFTNTANIEQKISAANARRDQDIAVRAQKFQNTLEDVGQRVMADLLPALEKLGPKFLELANVAGDVTTWIAENPKKAFAAAIGLSLARAGLESIFREGLEKLFRKVSLSPAASNGAPVPARGGSNLARAGLTGLAIGLPLAEQIYSSGTTDYANSVAATDAISAELNKASGRNLPDAILKAKTELARVQNERGMTGAFLDFIGFGNNAEVAGLQELIARKERENNARFTVGSSRSSAQVVASSGVQQGSVKLAAEIDSTQFEKGMLNALRSGVIKVELVGATVPLRIAEGPKVDPSGRSAK